MAKSESKQPWRVLTAALCLGFAGAAFGYLAGGALKRSSAMPALHGWHLAALPPVTFLAIAWHEFGHVVGGWLSGFQLMLFAVGPLKIERVSGRLGMSFSKSPHLWGGVAATAALDGVRRDPVFMRRALARIVAGGPLFSMLGAGLIGPAIALFHSMPSPAILLGMAGAMSLAIGLATLIPLSAGGFRSDGARLLQLYRGGEEADRWAHLSILSGLAQTVRPREWPGDLVAAACVRGGSGYDAVSAAWLRAIHHEDRGELDEARAWIEEALGNEDHWPKPARPLLHASAAYIYAQLGQATEARRRLSATGGAGFHMKEMLLLAEAAVLLTEKRWTEAAEAAERGLTLLPVDARGSDQAAREAFARVAAEAAREQ